MGEDESKERGGGEVKVDSEGGNAAIDLNKLYVACKLNSNCACKL